MIDEGKQREREKESRVKLRMRFMECMETPKSRNSLQ
jgi:hypothetical protein